MMTLFLLVCIKFSLDQSNIRNSVLESIRSGIAPERLIEFKFSDEESTNLNWKKNNEFELEGEMYDIVSIQKIEDGVVYECFHDTKESKYKRRFYKWLGNYLIPESGEPNENQTNKNVYKNYFCSNYKSLNTEGLAQGLQTCYVKYLNLYHLFQMGPSSRPPKF